MSTHNILMSTYNICFYGEIKKIIPKLSSNTLLVVPWLSFDLCNFELLFVISQTGPEESEVVDDQNQLQVVNQQVERPVSGQ